MYFTYVKPSAALAPYVKYYWVMWMDEAEGEETERVIPTDSIQLMLHYGRPFVEKSEDRKTVQSRSFLSGLTTGYTDVSTSGSTGVVAVTFRPLGAGNFFRFSLGELESKSVSLHDIDPRETRLLEERIYAVSPISEKIRILETYLMQRFCPVDSRDSSLMEEGLAVIEKRRGSVTISELSESLCLTGKTLERKFIRFIGIRPKQFLRIVRFQESVSRFSCAGAGRLTDLAYESGYFDQSHFIKEFKSMSGYTPKQFLAKYPCNTAPSQ